MGPSAEEEAAFLAEQRELGGEASVAVKPAVTTDEDSTGPLPPLEDLVARIPAGTRELLDELFRARFVTVKRVPASALKAKV